MSYILLFAPDATTFSTQGYGVLSDVIRCEVTEELNGQYELEMEYPIDGLHYSELGLRSLLVCDVAYSEPRQAFRIYKISEPLFGKVTIYARHVSYDLSFYVTEPFTASDASEACSAVLENSVTNDCPFTIVCHISTVGNLEVKVPSSIRSVLGGEENSILSVYGGEWHFNNFSCGLWDRRGENRGVTLRYGKNLTKFDREDDESGQYTDVIGYYTYTEDVTDGNGENTGETIERLITGSIIPTGTFDYTKILSLDCTSDMNSIHEEETNNQNGNDEEEEKWHPTVAEIDAFVTDYISEKELNRFATSVSLDFVQLEDVKEHIELGDTVRVYNSRTRKQFVARAQKVVWDVIRERYSSIDIGDTAESFSSAVTNSAGRSVLRSVANGLGNGVFDQVIANSGYFKELFADYAKIDYLEANYATINELHSDYANIETLEANYATIQELHSDYANIDTLEANYATIHELHTDYINTNTIEARFATIDQLTTDYLDADTIHANYITATDIQSTYATITNLNAATGRIGNLEADNVTINGKLTAAEASISAIESDYISTGSLDAAVINSEAINTKFVDANEANITYATITNLNTAVGRIADLEADHVTTSTITAINADIEDLQAADVTISGNITAATGRITELETDNVTINGKLTAAEADIEDLQADNVTINSTLTAATANIEDLQAADVTISGTLSAATADITSLKAADVTISGNLTAAVGRISTIESDYISSTNLDAAVANVGYLKTSNLDAAVLNAGYIKATTVASTYATATLSNVSNSWIENGTIKNAAITNAMISSVSASKLTAGTIDASQITVTNLNADNITVGTINGARIGTGSIDLDKLSEEVPTKEYLDELAEDLQEQIDGAIETFTSADVPTLTPTPNYPASGWAVADYSKHIGDICYVINENSQADGFCYRFAYDNTLEEYKWVLIKDSQVTAALQELIDMQGDISDLQTFESTTTSWMTNTDDELDSLKVRTTTVETGLGTKASTTQVSELNQDLQGFKTTVANTYQTQSDMGNYSTTAQMQSAIAQSASAIEMSVAAGYATKEQVPFVNILPTVYYDEDVHGKEWEDETHGITWTVNSDGSVTARGTATGITRFLFTHCELERPVPTVTLDPTKSYILHGCPENGSVDETYWIGYRLYTSTENPDGTSGVIGYDEGSGATIQNGYKYICAYAQIKAGYTCPAGGLTFYPMLEAGNVKHNYVSTHDGSGALVERISAAEASISVNANNIELKVSDTDLTGNYIASRINQSATTIALEASHINLEGAVTISNLNAAAKAALVTSNVSVYMRKTTSTAPSAPTGTIGTSANTDDAWEYVMPMPKPSRYFFTCERYEHADGSVTYSTVRPISNATYTSKWCSENDATKIDGANIYTGSITASQIAANAITADKISVTDLNAIGATIGGFQIDSNSIHTANVDVTSAAQNSVALSNSTFARTIGGTSRSNLKFAIGGNFAVNRDGNIYASSGNIGGFTLDATSLRTAAVDSVANNAIALSSSTFSRVLGTDTEATANLKFAIGKNFAVNYTGKVYCSSADISGKITATSGTIGGFTANSSYGLYTNNKTTANSARSGILIKNDGHIYAGAYDTDLLHCPVEIDGVNGNIYAHSGAIGGFTIDSSTIRTGASGTASAGYLTISSSDFSRTINATSLSTLRFAIGSDFGVTKTGKLYAKNAVISGNISASEGFIGNSLNGFTITSTGLYNGKSSIDADTEGVYLGKEGISFGSITDSYYSDISDSPAARITRTGESYFLNGTFYKGLQVDLYDAVEMAWNRGAFQIRQTDITDSGLDYYFGKQPADIRRVYIEGHDATNGFRNLYNQNQNLTITSATGVSNASGSYYRFGNVVIVDFAVTCTKALNGVQIASGCPAQLSIPRVVISDNKAKVFGRAYISGGALYVTAPTISTATTLYGHLSYITTAS